VAGGFTNRYSSVKNILDPKKKMITKRMTRKIFFLNRWFREVLPDWLILGIFLDNVLLAGCKCINFLKRFRAKKSWRRGRSPEVENFKYTLVNLFDFL
jgi:hypothetical protein